MSSCSGLQPITVALAMLGKIGIAAAFAVIYVWSAEIFPTVVRNAGMGSSSAFARVGGMVSPYIADIVSNTCTYVFVLFLKYIFQKLVFMFSFSRWTAVVVIVWLLDLQLSVQSVHISTKVMSSNPVHGEMCSIQHYVNFVTILRQIGGFLQVSSTNETYRHDIAEILLTIALSTIPFTNQPIIFKTTTKVKFCFH